jgi:hypothetical protein
MCFCVNNSNKVVFSVNNNSQTSLWNKGGTGTPKSSFYCTNYLHIVYAVAEGSPKDNIPPMLLEITINGGNKIHIKRTRALPGDPKNMESSYYADVHPDGKHIYIQKGAPEDGLLL